MNIGQFIILCIFFLFAIGAQIANTYIQLDKRKLNETELLLQISGIIATALVFGLGILGIFLETHIK